MDLNDPRLRLQVLNNSNPSIRIATAPKAQPTINIAPPRPQPQIQQPSQGPSIQLPKPAPSVGPQITFAPSSGPAPTPQPAAPKSGGFGNFIKGVAASLAKPFVATGADVANTIGNSEVKLGGLLGIKAKSGVQTNKQQFGNTIGNYVGEDTPKQFGTNLAEEALTIAAPGAGSEASLGARIGTDAAIGSAYGGTNAFGEGQSPEEIAKQAALGGALGGAGGVVLKSAGGLLGKLTGNQTDRLVSNITKDNSASSIASKLGINHQAAQFLASETNPETVRAVLGNLETSHANGVPIANWDPVPQTPADLNNPNAQIAPGVFDPSNPPQSFLDANLPGTHAPGAPDPGLQLPPEDVKAIQDAGGTVPDNNSPSFQRGYGKPAQVGNPDIATTPNAPNAAKTAYDARTSMERENGAPAFERQGKEAIYNQLLQHVQSGKIVDDAEWQKQFDNLSKGYESELRQVGKNPGDATTKGKADAVNQKYEQAFQELNDNHDKTKVLLAAAKNTGDEGAAPVAENAAASPAATTPAATEIKQAIDEAPGVAPTSAKAGDVPADTTAAPATDAKSAFPNADPASQDAIQQVMDGLNSAEKANKANAPIVSAEKGAKAGAMGPSYDAAGGGEAGMQAKLSSLKGAHSKSNFDPISVDPDVQKTLLDNIEKSGLRPFEKLNTQNALRKVWGANPAKPVPSDINYIRTFFNNHYGEGVGDEMGKAIQDAVDAGGEGWKDVAAKLAGTPRALMATGDLSFGGRQGAALGSRFPKQWGRANVESVKYALNKDYFDTEMNKIKSADDYTTITDKMNVQLPAADKNTEEAFASADYAEKIPGAGKVVQGSDRAYSGGLTNLRYNVAHSIIDKAGGPDNYLKVMENVYGDKADEAMQALGEVINTFSGRGGKAGGLVESHMKTLSTTLFAPRLWAAKLNSLNPMWYGRIYKANPEAGKLALQTQATFLATAGAVLSLAGAAGATIEWNPESADFAKIKVGNTRYDILGGLQQNIRLLAQEATGKKINSQTGQQETLGDGFGKATRKDILYEAFQNKENPLLSLATTLLEGHDQVGNPVNVKTEVADRLIPLNVQDIHSTGQDVGSYVKGAAMSLPGFGGVGVQTYGTTPTKDMGKDASGKPTYKGPIADNMVTDASGQPILDSKGAPVTVTFPPNATPLQKQAMLDAKRVSALKDAYTSTLPANDQALMKLSDTQLKQYVSDGTIDQATFDHIKNVQKTAQSQSIGNNYKVAAGITSAPATATSQKFNSMDAKDQQVWLNAKNPDQNSVAVAHLLNQQKSAGLDDFKPSNALAKLYADYESDIGSHSTGDKAYTQIDLRNKAKSFQTSAAKLNYDQNANDIYNEGGSSDLKTLLSNGKVQKSDVDKAIDLDNKLYAAGLESSLKFSKTFRSAYGYGVPSTGGDSNSSGSSSGAVSQQLTGILPSFGSGNRAKKPTITSNSLQPKAPIKFKAPANSNPGAGSSTVKIAPFKTTSVTKLGNSVAR